MVCYSEILGLRLQKGKRCIRVNKRYDCEEAERALGTNRTADDHAGSPRRRSYMLPAIHLIGERGSFLNLQLCTEIICSGGLIPAYLKFFSPACNGTSRIRSQRK